MYTETDAAFMTLANYVSGFSRCMSMRVGAVLRFKKKNRFFIGFNAPIAGYHDCQTDGCAKENGHCVRTIHAERNLINNLVKSGTEDLDFKDAVLYLTHKPCLDCLKALRSLGVRDFIVAHDRKDSSPFMGEILNTYGVSYHLYPWLLNDEVVLESLDKYLHSCLPVSNLKELSPVLYSMVDDFLRAKVEYGKNTYVDAPLPPKCIDYQSEETYRSLMIPYTKKQLFNLDYSTKRYMVLHGQYTKMFVHDPDSRVRYLLAVQGYELDELRADLDHDIRNIASSYGYYPDSDYTTDSKDYDVDNDIMVSKYSETNLKDRKVIR